MLLSWTKTSSNSGLEEGITEKKSQAKNRARLPNQEHLKSIKMKTLASTEPIRTTSKTSKRQSEGAEKG